MSKFRVQFSDSVKIRTIESPKGPYKVSLEGYFDFNEALLKLMIMNGNTLPVSSQFEPDSDSDSDSDMDFTEPQFDDVCDAMIESDRLSQKFSAEALISSGFKGKDSSTEESKPKPDDEGTSEIVDPT